MQTLIIKKFKNSFIKESMLLGKSATFEKHVTAKIDCIQSKKDFQAVERTFLSSCNNNSVVGFKNMNRIA